MPLLLIFIIFYMSSNMQRVYDLYLIHAHNFSGRQGQETNQITFLYMKDSEGGAEDGETVRFVAMY